MKYTENDFENARFATHPDGRFAARVDPADSIPWAVSEHGADHGWWDDAGMVAGGWVPGLIVTETELTQAVRKEGYSTVGPATRSLMAQFGLTITPDPKPTNAERLAGLIREIGYDIRHNGNLSGSNALALDLDARGVKAPGGGHE